MVRDTIAIERHRGWQTDRETERDRNRHTGRHSVTERRTSQANRLIDSQTDRQIDGQTKRQMERQTETASERKHEYNYDLQNIYKSANHTSNF